MVAGRGEAGAHRVDAHVGGAEPLPAFDLLGPGVGIAVREADTTFDTDILRLSAGLIDVFVKAGHRLVGAVVEAELREPAVGDAGRALDDGLGIAAHPDRDRPLDGKRQDAGLVDAVPASFEVDHFLGPQGAHNGDLLTDAAASGREVFAQGLVLDRVPANRDAQPQTSAGEHVDLGRLFRNQHCLSLGQDDDAAHELEALGDGAEVGKEDKGLVEAALVGVGAGAPAAGTVGIGADYVVIGEKMVVTEALGRLSVIAENDRVRANFGLGKDNADLDDLTPLS
jgi:hypothetical protein